jgi:hypothetical protein
MGIVPVMWIIWCILVVITAALYLYRSSLTRDEEDQIFLDDSFDHEKSAQVAILNRVEKVEPFIKTCSWLVAAATLFIVVYYALYIYNLLVR